MKKNYIILLLGITFVAGVVAGTLLVRSASFDTLSLLLRVVGGFVDKRRGQSLAQNFTYSSISTLAIVAALFFLGFCAIAQPLIASIPFFRGLGFGFSAASIYARYGAGATGYVAVFLLSGMILSTIAILFGCNEALRMSGNIFALLKGPRPNSEDASSPKIYCARFFVLALICILSAFLESILSFAFSGSFML